MIELTVDRSNNLEPTFDQLRAERFPGDYPQGTSRDEFDGRSQHLQVAAGMEAAAYGRLTLGPRAVFETWGRGKATLRTGADVADIGMCIVARPFEKMRLAELVYLEALLFARELGARWAMGAISPAALAEGSGLAKLLARLRIAPYGPPANFYPPPEERAVSLQPVSCDLYGDAPPWERLRTELDRDLVYRGYRVIRPWTVEPFN